MESIATGISDEDFAPHWNNQRRIADIHFFAIAEFQTKWLKRLAAQQFVKGCQFHALILVTHAVDGMILGDGGVGRPLNTSTASTSSISARTIKISATHGTALLAITNFPALSKNPCFTKSSSAHALITYMNTVGKPTTIHTHLAR